MKSGRRPLRVAAVERELAYYQKLGSRVQRGAVEVAGFVGENAKVDGLANQVLGVGLIVVPGDAKKHDKTAAYAGSGFAVNGNRGCRCPVGAGISRVLVPGAGVAGNLAAGVLLALGAA